MTFILYYDYSYTQYLMEALALRTDITLVCIKRESHLRDKLMSINQHFGTIFRSSAAGNKAVRRMLSEIKYDDTLILFDYLKYDNVNFIVKRAKCKTIHLWFWNTVSSSTARLFDLRHYNNVGFHTFDINDARKFNMVLHHQLYRTPLFNTQSNLSIDFFFIGMNKGRFKEIKELNAKLRQWGYNTLFIIVDKDIKGEVSDGISIQSKEIEYKDVLAYINRSRVLVDFTKNSQTGPTLRCLEGIFFNKKVLTNNESIKRQTFYNQNNFLVFDTLVDKKTIDLFLATETIEYTVEDKQKFDIEYWLNDFIDSSNTLS